jgi:TonB family protein
MKSNRERLMGAMIRWSLIVPLILWPALSCLAGDPGPQAEELIQASNFASDPARSGPYQLEATMVFHPASKDEARGRLVFYQETGRSRLQIDFTNYHETSIALSHRLYIARDTPFPPLELADMPRARPAWYALHLSGVPASKVFNKDIHGMQAQCFDVNVEKYERHRNCFDSVQKVLILTEVTTSNESRTIQMLDYHAVGEQLVPGTVRFLEDGKPMLELQKMQVKRGPADPALFALPPHALQLDDCDNMKPPQMLKRVEPMYPILARSGHIQGDVYVYMVIASDGTVQDQKVISGHTVLAQAVLDAIRQWHYTPAMCGSDPVSIESHTKVSFTVR